MLIWEKGEQRSINDFLKIYPHRVKFDLKKFLFPRMSDLLLLR